MSNKVISLEAAIDAVDAEPELPGPIPDDIFYALKEGDRETVAEFCRIVTRLTKRGIRERLIGGAHDSL
jgi:hypothetical protein